LFFHWWGQLFKVNTKNEESCHLLLECQVKLWKIRTRNTMRSSFI
jgi:hypothetical protein